MNPEEIARLLNLLIAPKRWCQEAEARTSHRNPVDYDDPRACSWSLDGALFKVLGPDRAMEAVSVFVERLDRLQRGHFPSPVDALIYLKNYNDGPARFSVFIQRILVMQGTKPDERHPYRSFYSGESSPARYAR